MNTHSHKRARQPERRKPSRSRFPELLKMILLFMGILAAGTFVLAGLLLATCFLNM